MLLITGATGTVGSEVVNQLIAGGFAARILVRSAETVVPREGITVAVGDFANEASLEAAMTGVDRVFFLPPLVQESGRLQRVFAGVAKRAGIAHVVKLSAMGTDAESNVELLRWHAQGEAAINDAGLTHTFLQPNGFMQNILGQAGAIAGQSAVFAPAGEARISHIDVRDIAAVAVKALTESGHENKTYVLSGPAAITYGEMASTLSEVLSKHVNYIAITPAQFRESMVGMGAPAWLADDLNELYAHYREGGGSLVTSEVETLTGRSARSFAEFATNYAPVLRGD